MQITRKKECACLLAFLGEESLRSCKERKEREKSVRVSWVGRHIVTVEVYRGQLLARVTAAFPEEYENAIEQRIQDAAMRESGYYHFSARKIYGFSLAEIAVYGLPSNQPSDLQQEIETMCSKLDEACLLNK